VIDLAHGRLPVLLEWHESFPGSLYEHHRNAQIQARQGNRNPLIDNPHGAKKTSLIRGLG
jgi:endonuclease I